MQLLLKQEFAKLLKRNEPYVVLLLSALLAVLSVVNQYYADMGGYQHYVNINSAVQQAAIYNSMVGQFLIFCLLPLFVSLPFADTCYLESKNNLLPIVVTRTNYAAYLKAKLIVVAISAFVAAILPFVFDQLLCLMTFSSPNTAEAAFGPLFDKGLFGAQRNHLFQSLGTNYPLLNNFVHILFVGVFGALLGIFTFVLTLYIRKNRIVALCTTTVVSMAWFFILEIVQIFTGKLQIVFHRYFISYPAISWHPAPVVPIIYFVLSLIVYFGLCLCFFKKHLKKSGDFL